MPEYSHEHLRRGWRLLWLSGIQAFADAQVQRQRWLDPAEGNPHYSFIECMCGYFDDALHGGDEPYRGRVEAGFLTEQEAAAVADFHALADAYESPPGGNWDAAAILDDPDWQKVVEAAQLAQKQLLALLADEAERLALMQP